MCFQQHHWFDGSVISPLLCYQTSQVHLRLCERDLRRLLTQCCDLRVHSVSAPKPACCLISLTHILKLFRGRILSRNVLEHAESTVLFSHFSRKRFDRYTWNAGVEGKSVPVPNGQWRVRCDAVWSPREPKTGVTCGSLTANYSVWISHGKFGCKYFATRKTNTLGLRVYAVHVCS